MAKHPGTTGEARLPRRIVGASMGEARRLLDDAAMRERALAAERDDLRAEVDRLQSELARYEELERLLRDTLVTAERGAEDVRTAARSDAEATLRDARSRAREIVLEAEVERERVQAEVRRLRAAEADLRTSYRAFLVAALERLEQSEAPTGAHDVL